MIFLSLNSPQIEDTFTQLNGIFLVAHSSFLQVKYIPATKRIPAMKHQMIFFSSRVKPISCLIHFLPNLSGKKGYLGQTVSST